MSSCERTVAATQLRTPMLRQETYLELFSMEVGTWWNLNYLKSATLHLSLLKREHSRGGAMIQDNCIVLYLFCIDKYSHNWHHLT